MILIIICLSVAAIILIVILVNSLTWVSGKRGVPKFPTCLVRQSKDIQEGRRGQTSNLIGEHFFVTPTWTESTKGTLFITVSWKWFIKVKTAQTGGIEMDLVAWYNIFFQTKKKLKSFPIKDCDLPDGISSEVVFDGRLNRESEPNATEQRRCYTSVSNEKKLRRTFVNDR